MLRINKSRIVVASCAALVGLGSLTTYVRSADEAKKPPSEEAQKMMELYMKLAQPGPQHAQLKEQFAGDWDVAMKSCGGEPGGPMVESKGKYEGRPLMDGRYIGQEYTGDMGGMKYHGMGMIGFDNASQKYIGAWIDNMSTGMMNTEGTYDEASKTYTMSGSFNDPSQKDGKNKVREVIKVKDNNSHQMMMYMNGPGGQEMLMMEATYTRKK